MTNSNWPGRSESPILLPLSFALWVHMLWVRGFREWQSPELQRISDSYQEKFLKDMGVDYSVQTKEFISDDEIKNFLCRFDHILVHLDIDVLDANLFHSTYFANKELVGDGSGSGRMKMEKLSGILKCITENANVVGFTIAEYLPFDEHKMHRMFKDIKIFNE